MRLFYGRDRANEQKKHVWIFLAFTFQSRLKRAYRANCIRASMYRMQRWLLQLIWLPRWMRMRVIVAMKNAAALVNKQRCIWLLWNEKKNRLSLQSSENPRMQTSDQQNQTIVSVIYQCRNEWLKTEKKTCLFLQFFIHQMFIEV